MGAAWLRNLVGPVSPTADLYLRNPCAALFETGEITMHAPTVFQAGDTVIIVRHTLGLQAPLVYEKLIYLIDDDWRAGLRASGLPASFRAKLALVEARDARRLEPLADTIVVSSAKLRSDYASRFPHKTIQKLDPVWPPLPRAQPPAPDAPLSLAYLGAWSHRGDFARISAVLRDVLDRHPTVTLTLPAQIKPQAALAEHSRVTLLPARNWAEYRNWLDHQQFDIGLYPLRATAFNAARSINKLMEYTRCGAAVISDAIWHEARDTAWTGALCTVDGSAQGWALMLDKMIGDPAERAALVSQARTSIKAREPAEQALQFWQEAIATAWVHP